MQYQSMLWVQPMAFDVDNQPHWVDSSWQDVDMWQVASYNVRKDGEVITEPIEGSYDVELYFDTFEEAKHFATEEYNSGRVGYVFYEGGNL